MANPIEIENIEAMRRREGIEDTELREEIRGLRIGDTVKLTFQGGPRTLETLLVRITWIRGSAFRGTLASEPSAAGLSSLRVGTAVAFTSAHIHSLSGKGAAHERRGSQT
jgi:hypothetical protein